VALGGAGIARGRQALVLGAGARPPDYPEAATEKKGARTRRGQKPVADGG
jgi:hypothetical protein